MYRQIYYFVIFIIMSFDYMWHIKSATFIALNNKKIKK